MVVAQSQSLGFGQRLLEFGGEFVDSHKNLRLNSNLG
jgi:hypothetical protein